MINVNPIKLSGNWFEGFALDLHTISSEFLGYDEFEHEIFDTKRSEIGELLYGLKYKSDMSLLKEILDVTANFLSNEWKIGRTLAGILPVLPSKRRTFQPVTQVARGISTQLQIPVYEDFLVKVKETPELKNVYDYQKRLELLKDAFVTKSLALKDKERFAF